MTQMNADGNICVCLRHLREKKALPTLEQKNAATLWMNNDFSRKNATSRRVNATTRHVNARTRPMNATASRMNATAGHLNAANMADERESTPDKRDCMAHKRDCTPVCRESTAVCRDSSACCLGIRPLVGLALPSAATVCRLLAGIQPAGPRYAQNVRCVILSRRSRRKIRNTRTRQTSAAQDGRRISEYENLVRAALITTARAGRTRSAKFEILRRPTPPSKYCANIAIRAGRLRQSQDDTNLDWTVNSLRSRRLLFRASSMGKRSGKRMGCEQVGQGEASDDPATIMMCHPSPRFAGPG
ncbi:MAG TPA: hypothetical protein VNN25_27600 [Thermoanaerobaculia bacterium]|nr:hypothetical protein [Thermoanaerobaculia bacterium]